MADCVFAGLICLAYAGLYEGPWETEIRALKFGGEIRLARPMAYLLAEQLRESGIFAEPSKWAVTAVPSGPGSSETIAAALAEDLKIELLHGLLARADGPRQRDLSLSERLVNADKVLTAGQSRKLDGRCIILVDDIATTLATLRRGAVILGDMGAVVIAGAVGAKTPRKGHHDHDNKRKGAVFLK